MNVDPAPQQPSAAEIIEQLHAQDLIAELLGVELYEVGQASVTVRMAVDERHIGGHGRCHGGVLFTLADIAMSYVCNRGPGQAVATHAAIDFVAPVDRGDIVEAVGTAAVERGRAAVHDVTLRVDGNIVGVFQGNTLRIG